MTARELKDRLRLRHPATQAMGMRTVPGPWTVIEEYRNVDVLAFCATACPASGAQRGVRYARVGYEVKVSRGDMRTELLKPEKRSWTRAFCHEFFFAVPKGLLTKEELAYREPEWADGDFERSRCPGNCLKQRRSDRHTSRWVSVIGPPRRYMPQAGYFDRCATCEGRGYTEKSRVEREAPTLWVPGDCGLLEVDGRGCRVLRKSPVRSEVTDLTAEQIGDLVRWVSARPDPRHDGVIERARARSRELTQLYGRAA